MYEAIDVMNLLHWPLQEEFLADKDGATCLSWNKSRFDVPMIMVGGNSDAAKVWGYNNSYRKWQVVAELVGHTDAIHDVCWAPNMGQSFHLLATASKDRTVRIWRLTIHPDDHLRAEVKEVARKHHHYSEVWRVEWNVTGTMLASSGDDGTVRMWKSDFEDEKSDDTLIPRGSIPSTISRKSASSTAGYMLDPKVSQLVSRGFDKESMVVFDEAHNIDNVCIEALSVELDRRALDCASRNLTALSIQVTQLKQADKARLDAEYRRLVEGLRASNAVVAPTYTDPVTHEALETSHDIMLANPVLPVDVLDEAIPGNIRRAEHFVAFLRRLIQYLRQRIRVRQVESETPQAFLHHLHQAISVDVKPMMFCYTRLNSLLRTLEVTNLEEYNSLTRVADFVTLVATYAEGFMLIIEPFDSESGVHDPVLQLLCLDASLAIRPVFERYASVIITSGTLSPIDLYPRLLNFNPVIRESSPMSVYRSIICPLVITRGSYQMPVSTTFDLRDDLSVVRNYGTLLLEMAACTPDGMIIGQWDSLGVLKRVLSSKLLFIETKDIVETTLALYNYKKACDCGRGAIFFSVARGKVAEGIDFDRHYGRAVLLFGIPFQYTLSNTLRARLEYLRYTHQIREGDFLTFDALRQAAQCAGRVLRSMTDYYDLSALHLPLLIEHDVWVPDLRSLSAAKILTASTCRPWRVSQAISRPPHYLTESTSRSSICQLVVP
ncbi:hypothetical protein PsorP6_010632 [Peronosclerospora sorghi]|uniref:Uncharacterized protein n=1 Tax=Peronosclerospora sorghi TaxID=230839 RepID=A0ACC0VXE3_9STRA|nr:hypothetical protein PsorP6_010632 [Peronosclerospora sorghi]